MGRREYEESRKRSLRWLQENNPLQAGLSQRAGQGCMICGDEANGLYKWKKGSAPSTPPAPMCADCAQIQQRMYGVDDELLRIE